MLKATILRASETHRLREIPRGSALVVDFGSEAFAPQAIEASARTGHKVSTLLVTVSTLAEPRLDDFLRQSAAVVIRHTGTPTIEEALEQAPRLARDSVQVELPLSADEHLTVLRILSSLGVRTRVDVSCIRDHGELARDALTDAMVKPGKRAAVCPFDDLERGFSDEQFELAQLVYQQNDHYVDLRDPTARPEPTAWDGVDVRRKRFPFLLDRHPCAFCEGLLYCNGHLYAAETVEVCRGFFSEFMELYDLLLSRREQASSGARSGADKRQVAARRDEAPR
jgi:hypothetical protein